MTTRPKAFATASLVAASLFALLSSIAACGGSAPPAESPPPSTAAPEPASTGGGAGNVAWSSMSREQRLEFMKSTVLPKMKEHFTKWDDKRFGGMNCATCHGDGAKDGTFKMPNPKLPKLPADEAGFKKLAETNPEATKFMSGTVVPEMTSMLGEQPFDPATGKGFGCGACHPH